MVKKLLFNMAPTKTNLRKYFYFLSDVVFYKIINLQYLSNN